MWTKFNANVVISQAKLTLRKLRKEDKELCEGSGSVKSLKQQEIFLLRSSG